MKHFILSLVFCLVSVNSLLPQKITKEQVTCGEKIMGLEFTDAEKDSMLGTLEEFLKKYDSVRNFPLQNNIPPALIFNPIPAGFNFPLGKSSIKFSSYKGTRLPQDINKLAFYSIGQLAELIRTKQITSVKLTEFFIERLKKFDPVLHCVISLTEKRAMDQAKLMDDELAKGKYRGILHGIPFGIKDLLATKDYKTTWGAEPFKDQMINQDAEVIKRLEKSGAVLIAKLTMGALAMGDIWFGGITRNPWDTANGSSGSSAGSASAVSAGLLPFAIGTETWGSIVAPSTVCGTTGLRPTYGRVSRTGAMSLSWSMDKIGTICRTAEDLAIVFNIINGQDGSDQTLYNVPFNYKPDINYRGLRIGYIKKDFGTNYPFHKNDSISLAALRKFGAELVPIELPDIPVNDISFILSSEASAVFDELTRSNRDDLLTDQKKDAWPNTFRAYRFVPAVEYINANRIRYVLIQKMQKIMNNIDLYVAPSWDGDNLLLTNLTGHPCVVVPNGFSEDGTPTSISFTGRLFEEGTLIEFAKKYQDATEWHKKHPKMFQ